MQDSQPLEPLPKKTAGEPHPWLAFVLSLLLPGLGQLYLGKLRQAIIWLALVIVGINAIALLLIYWSWAPVNVIFTFILSISLVLLSAILAYKSARASSTITPSPLYARWYVLVLVYLAVIVSWTLDLPKFVISKNYNVPTSAMEECIHVGEVIVADLGAYRWNNPAPNDLFLFLFPGDSSTTYIKRCIAIGGQVVEMREKRLFIDGQEIPDGPTVVHSDTKVDPRRDSFGPYRVPENHYFALGDNRDDSYDSRYWGPVPDRFVLGKAVRIFWSKDLRRIGKHLE